MGELEDEVGVSANVGGVDVEERHYDKVVGCGIDRWIDKESGVMVWNGQKTVCFRRFVRWESMYVVETPTIQSLL